MSSRLLIIVLAICTTFGLSLALKQVLPPIDFVKIEDKWYVPEKAPLPRELLTFKCPIYHKPKSNIGYMGWLDERGIINPGPDNKSLSMLTEEELERLWLDCTPGIYRIEYVFHE